MWLGSEQLQKNAKIEYSRFMKRTKAKAREIA